MPGWLSWVPRPRKRGAPTDPIADALAAQGIRHFDEDLLAMPIAELRRHFGYATTDGIRKELFFRNVIWQLHEQIQAGSPPDFHRKHGFIRGMWYHIKTRISRYKPLRGHYYGTMVTQLATLVRAGLVSYRDFNFRDRDQDLRKLGSDNRHIILFAEKDGFISILEELRDLYGCNIATMGGTPSLMSTNYLVSEMAAAGFDLTRRYVCLSMVDFDPDGWDTAGDFISNLESSGLRNFHLFSQYGQQDKRLDLVQPKNLEASDLSTVRYNLPARVQRSRQCATWAQLTGGIDGQGSRKYGLESDEFTQERIGQLVDQAITPFLTTPPEVVQRRARMRQLEKAVTDFMVYKLLHQGEPHGRLPGSGSSRPSDPALPIQPGPSGPRGRSSRSTHHPRQTTRRPRP